MKFTELPLLSTLAALLLPPLALACSHYDRCLCANADGSFHEAALKATCPDFQGTIEKLDDGRSFCNAKVQALDAVSAYVHTFQNCQFLSQCKSHGATGGSYCWDKDL